MATLRGIASLAGPEVELPLCDPPTLARAVTSGILDAPQLINNAFARGQVATRTDERGACLAVDPATSRPLGERERLEQLGIHV